jgi:hypothetical protein
VACGFRYAAELLHALSKYHRARPPAPTAIDRAFILQEISPAVRAACRHAIDFLDSICGNRPCCTLRQQWTRAA